MVRRDKNLWIGKWQYLNQLGERHSKFNQYLLFYIYFGSFFIPNFKIVFSFPCFKINNLLPSYKVSLPSFCLPSSLELRMRNQMQRSSTSWKIQPKILSSRIQSLILLNTWISQERMELIALSKLFTMASKISHPTLKPNLIRTSRRSSRVKIR